MNWSSEAGNPSPGEERVVVYTRQEVVGDEALNTSTLRSLGLLQGKCLLRLMHKVPESLKVQANVYAIKEKERGDAPEKIHRPMRLEAATLPKKDEVEEESHKKRQWTSVVGTKQKKLGKSRSRWKRWTVCQWPPHQPPTVSHQQHFKDPPSHLLH